MKLSTEDVGQVTVVVLDIDILDAGNAKEFKADMSPILEKSSKVVFDMSSVNFLDSSGCGALFGDMKLFGVTKPVRTLFELIRMHRIVEMYDTKEAALASF
jgi:anti-sigma B factor antagonist